MVFISRKTGLRRKHEPPLRTDGMSLVIRRIDRPFPPQWGILVNNIARYEHGRRVGSGEPCFETRGPYFRTKRTSGSKANKRKAGRQ